MGHRIVNLTGLLTIQPQAPASLILSGKAEVIAPTFLVAQLQQEQIQDQIEKLESEGYDMVHASETYILFFREELDEHQQAEAKQAAQYPFERTQAGIGSGPLALSTVP